MSRKRLIPVLFEVWMVSCFAFLTLVSISQLEGFMREVFQVDGFGRRAVDRLQIGILFTMFMCIASSETAKSNQASERGRGALLSLFIWSMCFNFVLFYEGGVYFPKLCNKDTALLYFSFSCITFMTALMHPTREEVVN